MKSHLQARKGPARTSHSLASYTGPCSIRPPATETLHPSHGDFGHCNGHYPAAFSIRGMKKKQSWASNFQQREDPNITCIY